MRLRSLPAEVKDVGRTSEGIKGEESKESEELETEKQREPENVTHFGRGLVRASKAPRDTKPKPRPASRPLA